MVDNPREEGTIIDESARQYRLRAFTNEPPVEAHYLPPTSPPQGFLSTADDLLLALSKLRDSRQEPVRPPLSIQSALEEQNLSSYPVYSVNGCQIQQAAVTDPSVTGNAAESSNGRLQGLKRKRDPNSESTQRKQSVKTATNHHLVNIPKLGPGCLEYSPHQSVGIADPKKYIVERYSGEQANNLVFLDVSEAQAVGQLYSLVGGQGLAHEGSSDENVKVRVFRFKDKDRRKIEYHGVYCSYTNCTYRTCVRAMGNDHPSSTHGLVLYRMSSNIGHSQECLKLHRKFKEHHIPADPQYYDILRGVMRKTVRKKTSTSSSSVSPVSKEESSDENAEKTADGRLSPNWVQYLYRFVDSSWNREDRVDEITKVLQDIYPDLSRDKIRSHASKGLTLYENFGSDPQTDQYLGIATVGAYMKCVDEKTGVSLIADYGAGYSETIHYDFDSSGQAIAHDKPSGSVLAIMVAVDELGVLLLEQRQSTDYLAIRLQDGQSEASKLLADCRKHYASALKDKLFGEVELVIAVEHALKFRKEYCCHGIYNFPVNIQRSDIEIPTLPICELGTMFEKRSIEPILRTSSQVASAPSEDDASWTIDDIFQHRSGITLDKVRKYTDFLDSQNFSRVGMNGLVVVTAAMKEIIKAARPVVSLEARKINSGDDSDFMHFYSAIASTGNNTPIEIGYAIMGLPSFSTWLQFFSSLKFHHKDSFFFEQHNLTFISNGRYGVFRAAQHVFPDCRSLHCAEDMLQVLTQCIDWNAWRGLIEQGKNGNGPRSEKEVFESLFWEMQYTIDNDKAKRLLSLFECVHKPCAILPDLFTVPMSALSYLEFPTYGISVRMPAGPLPDESALAMMVSHADAAAQAVLDEYNQSANTGACITFCGTDVQIVPAASKTFQFAELIANCHTLEAVDEENLTAVVVPNAALLDCVLRALGDTSEAGAAAYTVGPVSKYDAKRFDEIQKIKAFKVDLRVQTCTCLSYQNLRLPCPHAIALLKRLPLVDPIEFIPHFYLQHNYEAAVKKAVEHVRFTERDNFSGLAYMHSSWMNSNSFEMFKPGWNKDYHVLKRLVRRGTKVGAKCVKRKKVQSLNADHGA